MENGKKSSGLRFFTVVLALLLIACACFFYKVYSQNQDLQASNKELQAKFDSKDSILSKIEEEQKIISDSNSIVVNMVGTKAAPRSPANVYWDSTAAKVSLVVKNMPELASEEQYQLWALIDGKPKDLGVFDAKNNKVVLKMKDTQKADAFAITIEHKGGSVSPTLEKMQSIGKVKSL